MKITLDMFQYLYNFSQSCIACGKSTSHYLIRSTLCSGQCSIFFRKSDILARYPEIQHDPAAVYFILYALRAAAECDHLSLLGKVPTTLSAKLIASIITQIYELPQPLDVILRNIASGHSNLDSRAELVVAWGLSSYRGCVVAAEVGAKVCKFYVNETPERENQFARRLEPTGGKSSIVYHGTTLDRLYPILQNGLQTQYAKMMQHGAAHGHGVYVTPNIQIALNYSRSGSPASQSAQLSWEQRAYPVKMLLICELVSMEKWGTSNPEILVVTDSSYLIIRAAIYGRSEVDFGNFDIKDIRRLMRLAKS